MKEEKAIVQDVMVEQEQFCEGGQNIHNLLVLKDEFGLEGNDSSEMRHGDGYGSGRQGCEVKKEEGNR